MVTTTPSIIAAPPPPAVADRAGHIGQVAHLAHPRVASGRRQVEEFYATFLVASAARGVARPPAGTMVFIGLHE